MGNLDWKKVVCTGVVATSVMTALGNVVSLLGLPTPNIPGLLAAFTGMSLLIGWCLHFVAGFVLVAVYSCISDKLPLDGWQKGFVFGALLWLVWMVVLYPLMGIPFFGGGMMPAAGNLAGNLIFGGVVGCTFACGGSSSSSFD